VVSQRIGSVSGRNRAGNICVVSVYRDGQAIKLCGPSGSLLVADMSVITSVAANQYGLEDAAFTPTTRAA